MAPLKPVLGNESTSDPRKSHFIRLCQDFRAYHSNSLNVALHLLTTPLSIIAVMAMLNLKTGSIYATASLAGLYGFALGFSVPIRLYAATLVLVLVLVFASAAGPIATLDMQGLGLLFAGSYIGQELAHIITREVPVVPSHGSVPRTLIASLFCSAPAENLPGIVHGSAGLDGPADGPHLLPAPPLSRCTQPLPQLCELDDCEELPRPE